MFTAASQRRGSFIKGCDAPSWLAARLTRLEPLELAGGPRQKQVGSALANRQGCGETGRGQPSELSATKVNVASVTSEIVSLSRALRQADTLNDIEVRPTFIRFAHTVTSSPTFTGLWNLIASIATVAHLPRACRAATLPAARSICDSNHPPNMSPAGLVSAGIAIVRMQGFSSGGAPVERSIVPALCVHEALCRSAAHRGSSLLLAPVVEQ